MVTQKDKTLNEIIDMCVEKRVHYRQFLDDFILTHSEDWHDSADFTSGNGLTFYGDQNYLVCTKELCDEIVWQKMVPERVNAILTPDSTGSKLILGHVQSYNDLSYRRRPASEILWAMVKANGKRTN